jgi:hypothetical protein
MNKRLILVSRKPIVIHIFTLVCKKLNISLDVLSETQLDHKVDMVIIDSEFINDRFNILKSYTKIIGAISKKELGFEYANDFLIPVPFLPSTLQDILEQQIDLLNKRLQAKTYISNIEVENEDYDNKLITSILKKDDSKESVEYLEGLADDIADDMNEETDESMVSITSLNHGGILDNSELSILENIISEKNINNENQFVDLDNSEDKWVDLSSIIDQAIDEVNTVSNIYDKFDSKPIKLLLNNYDLEQLKPLLNMLDQNIIDSLTEGYEINLQLKLGEN